MAARGAVESARSGSASNDAEVACHRAEDGALVVEVGGAWHLDHGIPSADAVEKALDEQPSRVTYEASRLTHWDSSLVGFVVKVAELCAAKKIPVDTEGLPKGVGRLLALAEAVPEKTDARGAAKQQPWLARVGIASQAVAEGAVEMLAFIGDITKGLGRLLVGRARFRRSDLAVLIQQAGAEALPIVTLISFLVGAIFAFVGAVQLEQFGAAIYVADLVGIAMVRDMAAVMTGIVVAGRTGAAYAAQIGTMKVTQETDALTTLGLSALDFLVLPRMIALSLMMPLLCLYADLMGILGGMAVGVGMLHLAPMVYFQETRHAVGLDDLVGGVFKAGVYGVLVAIAGCLRGLQCGKSSSAVGEAATSAVVTGIVFIIVACGIFAVSFYMLDI
ncbi:MAG TPA: ABC transporter permease [Candidatus Binatia bacterium]|nr:ABC transporter permease [Candidatus Binatia bacterium]